MYVCVSLEVTNPESPEITTLRRKIACFFINLFSNKFQFIQVYIRFINTCPYIEGENELACIPDTVCLCCGHCGTMATMAEVNHSLSVSYETNFNIIQV